MDTMFSNGLKSLSFTEGVGSALCYVMLVGVTFLFLVTYIKRMVTIAFLIVIAPLVTVTYSIDKMGDSKSQALNTWLKEFSYNILIQPFQCVTYLALGQTAISVLEEGYSLKAVIIAIAMLIFILTSEKIIKHIFHFQSKSMTDTLQGAVVGTTLMSLVGKKGGKKSGGSSGGSSGDGSNKFADPEKSMTTPTSNPTNVRQGGGARSVGAGARGNASSGAGGVGRGATGASSTGTGGAGAGSSSASGALGNALGGAGKALGVVGAVAGKWIGEGMKIGGTATGAMLGLGATGSADKGMIQGGMLASGTTSKRVDDTSRSSKRRKLARAYNDYAYKIKNENPNKFSSDEEVNEQVRRRAVDLMQGNIDEKELSAEDKALRDSLKDLEKRYAKDGLSEEQRNEQLNKDFDGIESGRIGETVAEAVGDKVTPKKYKGKVKEWAQTRNARRREKKWGYATQAVGSQSTSQGTSQGRPSSGAGHKNPNSSKKKSS